MSKILIIISILFSIVQAENLNSSIRVNQLGYYPMRDKIAVIEGDVSGDFTIVDGGGNVVFTGTLEQGGYYEPGEVNTTIADFSTFEDEGTYRVEIANFGKSYEFDISKDVLSDALKASVKSYYFNRASQKIESAYGDKWARDGGHWDKNLSFHSSTGENGSRDVSGGWYDAGDFGKYIVNGGIAVSTLMSVYEIYPDVIGDNLNIPESGNGKSDLYDEIKYEIDWFAKMQASDGGVFFKVASLDWSWDVMPADDQFASGRVIIGKSTTSTLNFAAAMAQASRVYEDDTYLQMAEKAWDWANNNKNVKETEVDGSGSYGDTKYEDEFLWAASELYVTTGEREV